MTEVARERRYEKDFDWYAELDIRFAPDNRRGIRGLSDSGLHEFLAGDLHRGTRIALERELRRRDAWATPAAVSLPISVGSLICAIAALIIAILKH